MQCVASSKNKWSIKNKASWKGTTINKSNLRERERGGNLFSEQLNEENVFVVAWSSCYMQQMSGKTFSLLIGKYLYIPLVLSFYESRAQVLMVIYHFLVSLRWYTFWRRRREVFNVDIEDLLCFFSCWWIYRSEGKIKRWLFLLEVKVKLKGGCFC